MGDRNTIVVVALVAFVTFTAVFSGIAFYYSMERETLTKSKKAEDALIKDLRIAVDANQGPVPQETAKILEATKKLDDAPEVRAEAGDWKSMAPVSPESGGITAMKTSEKEVEDFLAGKKTEATKSHADREAVDAKRTEAAKADAARIAAAYKNLQDTLKQLDEAIGQQQGELRKAQDELLEAKSADVDRITKLVGDISTARDKLVILEDKLKRMKERRERLDRLNEDGRVIAADPDTNLAVVDLGARQGVRPGMIFDVFEVKKNGDKVRKAKIRLQRVESQQSTAVILAARPVPKSCPQCGWSTTESTVLYCPYCRGGEPPTFPDVVRLVDGSSTQAVVAPDFLNPLTKGDWISSPFYLGGKNRQPFMFAIAGQPVNHSRQEIQTFLKENGCRLAEDITIDTDFTVVGTGPNVEDELKKARALGVSILREQDLFNFFGQLGSASDLPRDEAEATSKG